MTIATHLLLGVLVGLHARRAAAALSAARERCCSRKPMARPRRRRPNACSRRSPVTGRALGGGASIGVVLFGGETDIPAAELLIAADVALADAKPAGRGEIVIYAGQTRALDRWVVRRALDLACAGESVGGRLRGTDERVVRSIVSIAHAFGVQSIAEGVEDQATLERLRMWGVDYAQGYHLGGPSPVTTPLVAG